MTEIAYHDQAEGLRKLFDTSSKSTSLISSYSPTTSRLSLFSCVTDNETNSTLTSLAMLLGKPQSPALIVDAKVENLSLSAWLSINYKHSLLSVIKRETHLNNVMKSVTPHYQLMRLANHDPTFYQYELNKLYEFLIKKYATLIINNEFNTNNDFHIPSFEDGDIVIQLSPDTKSITQAYSLIKRLQQRQGTHHSAKIGLLISSCRGENAEMLAQQAHSIYESVASTAWRYLRSEITLVGYLPEDVYLRKAIWQGKSVCEAYPQSSVAQSYRQVSQALALGLHSSHSRIKLVSN